MKTIACYQGNDSSFIIASRSYIGTERHVKFNTVSIWHSAMIQFLQSGEKRKLSTATTRQNGAKTSVGPGFVGITMVTGTTSTDGKLTT